MPVNVIELPKLVVKSPDYPKLQKSLDTGNVYMMVSESRGFRLVGDVLRDCLYLDGVNFEDYEGILEVSNVN